MLLLVAWIDLRLLFEDTSRRNGLLGLRALKVLCIFGIRSLANWALSRRSLLGRVALGYIVGNLSRFSSLGLIDFTFLPMRSGGLASHDDPEKSLGSWISDLEFVIEHQRGTAGTAMGGDLLEFGTGPSKRLELSSEG